MTPVINKRICISGWTRRNSNLDKKRTDSRRENSFYQNHDVDATDNPKSLLYFDHAKNNHQNYFAFCVGSTSLTCQKKKKEEPLVWLSD